MSGSEMIVPRVAPFSEKEVFILDVSKFRKRASPKPIQPVESDPGQEIWVPEAGEHYGARSDVLVLGETLIILRD